jgi:hypothetical protein
MNDKAPISTSVKLSEYFDDHSHNLMHMVKTTLDEKMDSFKRTLMDEMKHTLHHDMVQFHSCPETDAITNELFDNVENGLEYVNEYKAWVKETIAKECGKKNLFDKHQFMQSQINKINKDKLNCFMCTYTNKEVRYSGCDYSTYIDTIIVYLNFIITKHTDNIYKRWEFLPHNLSIAMLFQLKLQLQSIPQSIPIHPFNTHKLVAGRSSDNNYCASLGPLNIEFIKHLIKMHNEHPHYFNPSSVKIDTMCRTEYADIKRLKDELKESRAIQQLNLQIKELNGLRSEQKDELNEWQAIQNTQIEKIKSIHDKQLKKLKEEQIANLKELQESHAVQIAKMQMELDSCVSENIKLRFEMDTNSKNEVLLTKKQL